MESRTRREFVENGIDCVEVEFYDEGTDEILGSATYKIQPGKAIESMDDVEARIVGDMARLQEALDAPVVEI